jgi:hypothetical protein
MLSSQEEQAERRRVFAQDQSLPKQATTFHQFAQADADTPRGRFAAVSAAYVVGSTAVPQYPAASTPFQHDPVGDEPPLGLDNPALEPSFLASLAQAPDPTSADAHSGDVQRTDVGPLSSPPNPATDVASLNCSEGPEQPRAGLGLSRPYRRY